MVTCLMSIGLFHCCLVATAFAGERAITLRPDPDLDSLIRNPACGWMLYDDACGMVAEAAPYWQAQDQAARKCASIFYVRWRWSDMEPEEGRYAWKEDANFKALIAGAKQRGLRLAFRVYVCGWDNAKQATPDYVFAAGAKGQVRPGAKGEKFLTPNADDPIFRRKLEAFLDAFAREFDDPSRVDFIDGCGLGRWGEGHSLTLADPKNEMESLEWVAEAYAKRFKRTLLGWQLGINQTYNTVIKERDFLIRRDGIGSIWFKDAEKKMCTDGFPRYPLFAERCYWGDTVAQNHAKNDKLYGPTWKTWRDIDATAVDEAIRFHANTLDLRTIADTARFMTYPELVMRFCREGGYRLVPEEVTFPERVKAGTTFTLLHSWRNYSVGVLPNLNQRWVSKYHPAWILLQGPNHRIIGEPTVEKNAEPGTWVKEKSFSYETAMSVPAGTPPGTYKLACAILNTARDGMPDLNLALKTERYGAWHVVGDVTVSP